MWRLRGRIRRNTEREILLALGLRCYAHPAPPTRNPLFSLYLCSPIRRYKTDRLLSPFSDSLLPRASPELRRHTALRFLRRRRADFECPWSLRPSPRLPEAEAEVSTRASPVHPHGVRRKRRWPAAAAEEEPRRWGPHGGWCACVGMCSPRA
jgi:hypothetical protein